MSARKNLEYILRSTLAGCDAEEAIADLDAIRRVALSEVYAEVKRQRDGHRHGETRVGLSLAMVVIRQALNKEAGGAP